MSPLLLGLSLAIPAQAGSAPWPYGVPSTDPYTDGFPSADEREIHMWTNAVRIDPEAFEQDYPCGMGSFSDSESSPHDPLYLDMGLAEAARYHSQDMSDNSHFSHDSSDGTSFGERVSWFYTDSGMVGENIAWNYSSNWAVVIEGWMCSDGHRANIMADYNELGVGVVNEYDTQDFGAGDIPYWLPVAMGAHTPVDALQDATFLADWLDDTGPTSLQVVIDGSGLDLELWVGTDSRGVYSVSTKLEAVECHEYFFRWTDAKGESGTFPEQGSYTWGSGCTDGIGWIETQGGGGAGGGIGVPGGDTEPDGMFDGDSPDLSDPRLVGCSANPTPSRGGLAVAVMALLGLALGRRRRP